MRKTAPVKSTKKKTKKTSKANYGKISLTYARELQMNWRQCIPSVLGDLFTYEAKDGISRFLSYDLDYASIKEIVTVLNKSKDNVANLSFALGLTKEFAVPRFQPLLQVTLKNPVLRSKEHYFLLKPLRDSQPIGQARLAALANISSDNPDEQLSPKVAEIFMLKWQSLTEGDLIAAFEGVTPNSVSVQGSGEDATVSFGNQSIRRVEKYIFVQAETKVIIDQLTNGYEDDSNLSFFIHMGAGLKVADFHPFDFRPIINIISDFIVIRENDGDGGSSFFDTSRPCPPFCPDRDPDDGFVIR